MCLAVTGAFCHGRFKRLMGRREIKSARRFEEPQQCVLRRTLSHLRIRFKDIPNTFCTSWNSHHEVFAVLDSQEAL